MSKPTPPMHRMLDDVTAEEKRELREKIENGAGSPYHRTLLAMFRDLEEENERLRQGITLLLRGEEQEARELLDAVYYGVEDAFVPKRLLDEAQRVSVALNKERRRAQEKYDEAALAIADRATLIEKPVQDVLDWLDSYAKELSQRGKDAGSPSEITEASRQALVVRQIKEQLNKVFVTDKEKT